MMEAVISILACVSMLAHGFAVLVFLVTSAYVLSDQDTNFPPRLSPVFFGLAILCAATSYSLFEHLDSRSYNRQAAKLVEVCEENLPRNQNCIVEIRAITPYGSSFEPKSTTEKE